MRLEEGVGYVGGGEVVAGHFVLEDCGGDVDEEAGVGGAGAAEKDGGGGVVVPGCGFGDDFGAGGGICEVGGDEVEALGGIDCFRLRTNQYLADRERVGSCSGIQRSL